MMDARQPDTQLAPLCTLYTKDIPREEAAQERYACFEDFAAVGVGVVVVYAMCGCTSFPQHPPNQF